MTTPLRAVIFDVDGTLIDSQGHIVASMTHAYTALNVPMPARETILSIVGLSLPQAFARLSPDLSDADRAQLIDGYKAGFAELRKSGDPAGHSPLYPGALAALDKLAQDDDILLGIATGKSRRGLDAVLASHDLSDRFITQQVADHHPSKPHPSMIHAALTETGVDAKNAVMIGDTTFDMSMARAAGVAAIGVSWGYHPTSDLEEAGAHVIVSDFDALNAALNHVWRL
jgi:phosphoglycolate phosphatase